MFILNSITKLSIMISFTFTFQRKQIQNYLNCSNVYPQFDNKIIENDFIQLSFAKLNAFFTTQHINTISKEIEYAQYE